MDYYKHELINSLEQPIVCSNNHGILSSSGYHVCPKCNMVAIEDKHLLTGEILTKYCPNCWCILED